MRNEPTASVLMGRDCYRPVVPSLENAGGFAVLDTADGEPEPTIIIPDPNPNPVPAPIIPDPDPSPEPAPIIPDPAPPSEPEPAPATVALNG